MATSAPSPQDELASGIDPSTSSESAAEGPLASKGIDSAPSPPTSSESSRPSKSSGNASTKSYPLYPSVAQLLREKDIPSSEAGKIPATGPKGRLLKGDVLAYLGNISSSYASDQSARISKLADLDLSTVQIAPPKKAEPSAPSQSSAAKAPAPEPDAKIAVRISLKAVLEVQKRVQSTLGVTLPLSTFITRATKAANQDLPRASTHTASADELFNQILGLDTLEHKASHGNFTPQIIALPTNSTTSQASTGRALKPDIIDELTSARPSSRAPSRIPRDSTPNLIPETASEASVNVFSVSAKRGEEKRAKVFLERVKTMLQVEPGTLVL